MTATVRAGERGFDSSFSHPPVQRTLELGFTFRLGYISVYPASPGKNITIAECVETIAAGQKLLLIWEMSASRASLGELYGKADGANARQLAKARGYPLDVPILVADDTNTVASNIDAQEAYMRGFASACWPYPIGIYGDTDILGRCAGLWQIGWMPNAWSWSGVSRANAEAKAKALGAHVLQHTGFYIDQTWAVDPNVAIADFQAWGYPDPIPQGDDDMKIAINKEARSMPYGLADPFTAVFVVGEFKRNVGREELDVLYPGVVPAPLTNAALDAIPDYTPSTSSTAPTRFAITLTGGAVAQ